MQLLQTPFMVLLTATLFASSSIALPTPAPSADVDFSVLFDRNPRITPRIRAICDMKKAVLPVGTGSPALTGPTPLTLKLVVLGQGTQNYTCVDNTANSKPVAAGALATLYDVSCLAAEGSAILHKMPEYILTKPNLIKTNPLFPKVGTHFFYPDTSTPVFVMNENLVNAKMGKFVGKKAEGIPAPVTTAVDWLKLVNKIVTGATAAPEITSNGYAATYRVYTAGGKPPADCNGRGPSFTVPYTAEYWLYN